MTKAAVFASSKLKNTAVPIVLWLTAIMACGCATHSDRLREAQSANDYYFDCIKGVDCDEIISASIGKVEWVLFTSNKARCDEYRRRHKVEPPPFKGLFWASGTPVTIEKIELWVPAKRLKNGRLVIHPGVLMHEETHAIDHILRPLHNPSIFFLVRPGGCDKKSH